ncbi:MAG: hypothetical protein K6F44_08365, partial [Lachnospiraceae bacterium]|nr:hypothetical protein [Lachnospiraceae bacterium]
AIFNIMVSTYGLVVIGVILGTVVLVRFIRKRSETSNAVMAFTVFSVILFLGTFAMSIIYFFPYVMNLLEGTGEQRSDWLAYGRYAACGCGPCVLIGLYLCMYKKEKLYNVLKMVCVLVYAGISVLFVSKVTPLIEGVSAVTRNFISLCTFVELKSEGITTAVIPDITESFLKSAFLSGVVLSVVIILSLITKKAYSLYIAALFLSVVSVIITFVDYDKIRLSRDEKLESWIIPVTDVIRNDPVLAGCNIYVTLGAKSIKHYQFMLPDHVCFSPGSKLSLDSAMAVISAKNEISAGFGVGGLVLESKENPKTAKDRVSVRRDFWIKEMQKYGLKNYMEY